MFQSQIKILTLAVLVGFVAGCGVKTDPVPPDISPELLKAHTVDTPKQEKQKKNPETEDQ